MNLKILEDRVEKGKEGGRQKEIWQERCFPVEIARFQAYRGGRDKWKFGRGKFFRELIRERLVQSVAGHPEDEVSA